MENQDLRYLAFALQGIADVLRVPLVVTTEAGDEVVAWQWPSGETETDRGLAALPLTGCGSGETGATVIGTNDAARRFAVALGSGSQPALFVQSGVLPARFRWLDGTVSPQFLPGVPFEMAVEPEFLLGLFVASVCRVVLGVQADGEGVRVDDLDVENVRRIGLCLGRKIGFEDPQEERHEFSIEAIPSLESFFVSDPHGERGSAALTEVFRRITAGTTASFNLMALSGDFVIEAGTFQDFCVRTARQSLGKKCFASDITCLIEAALLGRPENQIPLAMRKVCHAGFTEVFAAVFSYGHVVGLVSGGQLILRQDAERILTSGSGVDGLDADVLSTLTVAPEGSIERTEEIVSGLSAVIGLLIEKYSLARSQASLRGVLVTGDADEVRETLHDACMAVKRYLAVTECCVFSLVRDGLVLEATSARRLATRETAKGPATIVDASEALGRTFYRAGEGLTGSVVVSLEPRFEESAMDAVEWAGKCGELLHRSQCFLAPIIHDDKCYGVLRASRPAEFDLMPLEHRQLMATFARELAMVLEYRRLVGAESAAFQQRADELQDMLVEAAHEFRAPLHHVLQISTALRYTDPADSAKLRALHQNMKEEVYRAKKHLENYLVRGIEGREELKYDFLPGNLGDLVRECASRFEHAAARRGLRIAVDPSLTRLPEIVFDRGRMEQVFTNVIDNAVKYSFEDQRDAIRVRGREKENTITVSITDKGLGIPPESRGLIFKGYQRAVDDKRRFKPGTGLGLKIAKEIVDKHGGSIHVESVPYLHDPSRLADCEGYTTTFIVSLPRPGPPAQQDGPEGSEHDAEDT